MYNVLLRGGEVYAGAHIIGSALPIIIVSIQHIHTVFHGRLYCCILFVTTFYTGGGVYVILTYDVHVHKNKTCVTEIVRDVMHTQFLSPTCLYRLLCVLKRNIWQTYIAYRMTQEHG